MATKKPLSLLFFLFAFLFACNDDHVVLEKNEGENILEDHTNPQDVKIKNRGASARVNIEGGHATLTIDSPVDPSGNVIIGSSGTTLVNFRVVIVRNSASSNVHLQFQIRNSNQSVIWTSSAIRTLDFANNQLEKTVFGSFNISAAGVNQGNYDLCLFVRDFIAVQDFTGDCKNTIIGTPDLTITNKSVSNSSVSRGQSVMISTTVKNQGTEKIWGTFIGYYLSTDTSFGNDTYIGDSEIATLNPGQSITKSESVVIPSTLAPGNYYIIFFADYQYQVIESNENNNFAFIPITVL